MDGDLPGYFFDWVVKPVLVVLLTVGIVLGSVALAIRVRKNSDLIKNSDASQEPRIVYAYVRSDCGNTFTSSAPPAVKKEYCPLCPLTDGEFKRLQEQLKRQHKVEE